MRNLRELLADVIEASALDLLDPDRLQAIAEDLRVVERRRGYDAGLVAVSLILSAMQRSTDTQGRLVDARRVYEMLGGERAQESGFRKVARKVAPVLRVLLKRRLGTLATAVGSPELRGRLEGLRDVLIPDGCAFKLAATLASSYAGTGQDSELKLHAVYSVRAGGLVSLHATAGAVHDNDGFAPQTWQKGALYIWDLGYNDYGRVIAATKAGALVLQRLKSGANPKVIASYGENGHRRKVECDDGSRIGLELACASGLVHRRAVLDLDVELGHEGETAMARVVCVPFGGEDRYYLTTLARADFTPYDVAELYRLRWEIELFFRGLKGATRLDEVRRLENKESLHAIVYSTLLAGMLARDITATLNELELRRDELEADEASSEAFPPGAAGRDIGGQRDAVREVRADTRIAPERCTQDRQGPSPADILRSRLAACSRLPAHSGAHERHVDP